jgi:hypothetical protein
MHARFSQSEAAGAGRGVRGTFYPAESPTDGRSIGSGIAKVAIVLVALAVVRNLMAHGRHGGGGSGMSRRRQMISELHRQLHAEDAAEAEAPTKA